MSDALIEALRRRKLDYTTEHVLEQARQNQRKEDFDNSVFGIVHNWATEEQRQPVQLPDDASLWDRAKEHGLRVANLPMDMIAGGAKTMAHWLGSAAYPEMIEPVDMLAPLGIGAMAGLAGAVPRRAVGSVGGRVAADQARASMPGLLAGAADEPKGITAYHGSPYDFDSFSLDKIGTGEGAQAYGHGLYFAENEGVAKSYRDSLSNDGLGVVARGRLRQFGGDIDKTIEYLRGPRSEGDSMAAANSRQALQELEAAKAAGSKPGHMYEVRINADPEDFLDWDKPLSQQSEKVRKALAGIAEQETANLQRSIDRMGDRADVWPMMNELDAMTAMSQRDYMPKEMLRSPSASRLLEKSGIPGIRYLDQGSRTAGDGSRNYVLFRDDIIDIVKKYGIAAAASMYGMQAVDDVMASQQ